MDKQEIKMPNLKVRLLAELTQDKKKASILIVLVLVVGVFAGRLVLKQILPSKAGAAGVSSTALVAPAGKGGVHPSAVSIHGVRGEYAPDRKIKITRDIFRVNTDMFAPVGFRGEAKLTDAAKASDADRNLKLRIKAQAQTLELQSTIIGPSPVAIINGRVVRKGEYINNFQVVDVVAHSCIVMKKNVKVVLEIKNWRDSMYPKSKGETQSND